MSSDGEGETSPSWIFWAMANVFSGLRSVVDILWQWCVIPVGTFPMDTLNTLLLGWLAFGFLIVILAKFSYDKFLAWDQTEEDDGEFYQGEIEGPKLPTEGCKGPPPPPPVVTKKATIVPDDLPKHVLAPIATGGDPDAVRWINNLLVWFFEGTEGGRVIREAWNDRLNDFTVGAALETGVLIEVLEFFPQTPAPTLTNIIVDCAPTDDMVVTCDLEADLYMRVQTTRTQRDVTTESEYACAVRPLRGRFSVSWRTHQGIAFLQFDEWPEVYMELEGVRNNAEGLDEFQLQEVLKEELTAALRKVTLQLDFQPRKGFPRFYRERTLPDSVIPIGYDALNSSAPQTSSRSPVGIVGLNGKRLLVKVVKATTVGGDAGVSSCYAVIEMDDPPQKFTTNVVKNTSSPFWDEQFLFDLNDNTLELLFELYDKNDGRFVGLGIVGIEELVATPSQRQIIPLQGRPYEKDEVSGSLTCEFLFLDRADLPDLNIRKSALGQKLTGGKVKTTTKTYTMPNEDKNTEEEYGTPGGVAEAALKDLEEKPSGPSLSPNTRTTLIIHASRKPMEEEVEQEEPEEVDNDDFKPGVTLAFGTGIVSSGTERGLPHQRSIQSTHVPSVDISSNPPGEMIDVQEPSGVPLGSPNGIDEGKSAASSPTSPELQVPSLLSVPKFIRGRSSQSGGGTVTSGDSGSTRSSLSGTSGFSSTSTKTYINEASLLVVETLENGIIKHYLVPLSLQRKNKWRRKGTKLHIYNEHTFVAKHLSSSLSCQVCQKGIGRRIGKQGYECRDCSFKCHKPCHVKTEIVCPNSTVNSMDLVFVKDDKPDIRRRQVNS